MGGRDKAELPVSSFGAPRHSSISPFFATSTHSDAITGIVKQCAHKRHHTKYHTLSLGTIVRDYR